MALTEAIPDNVAGLLDLGREPIEAAKATTAVFYSISNTQKGLAGVSFGNFLIKQVVEDLKARAAEREDLRHPLAGAGLRRLAEARAGGRGVRASSTPRPRTTLALLDEPGWHLDPEKAEAVRAVLIPVAAHYFLKAKDKAGRPVDPVARFHLGNGARLERLNFLGDVSPNGLRQAHGLMVNYLYDLGQIEKNHEALAEKGRIAASDAVRAALPPAPQS